MRQLDDVTYVRSLEAALRQIAMQQKSDEIDQPNNADFEGAYDTIIEIAREAIAEAR